MNPLDPKQELTKLERLSALLREDNSDVETMDAPQLAHYLASNKVDMAGPQKRFDVLLKKAKARRQLETARARRLQAGEKAHQLLSAGSTAVEVVRDRVRDMIEKFRQHDPDQALVYAREFEKATPEDLQILEEDLMLLELEQPDNGTSNKQNPS